MTGRLAPIALALVTACSGGESKDTPPSGPDETLFQSGLAHWDAAVALADQARLLTDPTARAAKETQAIGEYGLAQADFRALAAQYPSSVRVDNAAYLDGRCDYEIGTITGERARFEAALARLDAAVAAHPASKQRSSMLYFAARSEFQLAALDAAAASPSTNGVAGRYATARARFSAAATAAASEPSAVYGDNAAYYVGRCDFEIGYVRANPLEAGAVTPVAGSAGWNASDAAFTLAESELIGVPTSSTYRDNARFYLGRTRYERLTDVAATRIANLQGAIAAFADVLAIPGSFYASGAHYWSGRSRYALAFRQGTGGVPLASGLDAAIADLEAVDGAGPAPSTTASVYADNALSYVARSYVNLVPAFCTTARGGDPAPASACAARAALVTRYPASVWISSTDTYLAGAGCNCP